MYIVVIAGLVVILGLLFYPTIHLINGVVDLTNFLPLTAMATVAIPYVFLVIVAYAVFKLIKR